MVPITGQTMGAEAALNQADELIFAETGRHLSDLQRAILQQVWQGRKYWAIAESYGCTEGHVKDVASHLWRILSKTLGEKVSKNSLKAVLARRLGRGEASQLSAAIAPPHSPPENPNFVGRKGAIADLDRLISQGKKVIVIQGEGGIGKTTLAQQYLHAQDFELVLELLMAKETAYITPVERVVEEWLKQDFGVEPGREFGVTLGRLKRQLHNRRVGVLVDNLEPALDSAGRFVQAHSWYVELLRVLADNRVQSVTLITSRDRLCEPAIHLDHFRLPGLDQSAWRHFFQPHGIAIDSPTLQAMHRAYGGNAKAMGILCGSIQGDFEGDMAAYWRETNADPLVAMDLKNLAASQINRLQALDSNAYRLFCRLGCYRYQEVPTVPTDGLFHLMWDIAPDQQRRIITSLRNRSLLEGRKGEYWLHPVIRAEAIARLRASGEWEIVNRKAADYWTSATATITTVGDAMHALEAYYHYLEIEDFEAAGGVILKSRDNRWRQFLPLGSTLYRMGLLQPVITAISKIIHQTKSDQNASELHNILGDVYWISGQIHPAIACQEVAIQTATRCLQSIAPSPANRRMIYYLRMLEVDSLLSLGLYQLDLWELAASANLFQQVIDQAASTDHDRWAEKASVCLALVNSYLGMRQEAYILVDQVYDSVVNNPSFQHTGRFAYFIQILGQTFSNLGERDKAYALYQKAIAFAQASHYIQVKARSLSGLAELYRQQQEFDGAIAHHQDAINLLEEIGAKCDLAEAYFQLGLTHQVIGHPEIRQKNFEQAIGLFKEIDAPKQVAKVIAAASEPSMPHAQPPTPPQSKIS
ncbi:MAG: tetratricopeptide repeat protein [Leptolyngbyaceae cyanobacterium MO_188.B28]|nr:tetratricopeptide repeat protein [Leptolyngbyaceae cyanobacterium MO_188.B28]